MSLSGGPAPGAVVELRADMDVVVLLANSPHPLDDRAGYNVSPVRVTGYRPASIVGEAIRTSSPERTRAFENTDELLLELS
jgi:uncharacterized protein YcgI (DUF1989 family)